MKIHILSMSPNCYSTRRLVEAAKDLGHDVAVRNSMKYSISLDRGKPELFYKGRPAGECDTVIPRIGASITFYGTALVRQFQQMDVFCLNSATGIANSRDKLRSLQILSRHDIGIPPTEFVRDKNDVVPAIERLGGVPVIIKLLEGTQGVGVILADTLSVARAIIETMQSTQQNVLIQKFVAESRGRDIRAFVVGDQVVGAMRRVAQGDEFRSNVHRGGRVELVELDEQYRETALRAAQIMNLNVAGVDMLESSAGPQIMEVNSSPGLEGIEAATGKDIARAVIEYAANNVKFPEMDIRYRLTVGRGYGVNELQIGDVSKLAGKSIEESSLRDKDINVLSLTRDGKIIPNPRKDRVLKNGDMLLVYGKIDSLKELVPGKVRKLRENQAEQAET